MTRLRLYDRLRDEIVDVEPGATGALRVYSCGPTVYGRIHVGNARPYWTAMVLKRACEQLLGLPVRLAINITDVNDKIYLAAAEQGVPSARARRRDGRCLSQRHRGPRPRPARCRAARERDDSRDRGADREARRARRGLRERRRRRLLQCRGLSRLRGAVGPAAGRADRGLARRAGRGQALPARLRALEGQQAGRGHRLGFALGPGPPRLAHRVLGDGARASSARTSTCTAAASTSSSRTTRTSARSPRPRASASRACGCTTGCCASRARRCRSRSATSTGSPRRSSGSGARRCSPSSPRRTTAALSITRMRRWSRPPGPPTACARRCATRGATRVAAAATARRPSTRPRRVRALRRLHGRRPRHAARARGAPRARARHQRRRRGRRGRTRPRSRPPPMRSCAPSTSSAWPRSTARRRPPTRRSRSPSSAPSARAAGDYARADELRDRIAALGFAVRDTPQGPQVVPLDG